VKQFKCNICRDAYRIGCVFCNAELKDVFQWRKKEETNHMCTIIKFPRHLLSRVCLDDGLSHCITCAGAEGSLPTHCPQSRMSMDTEDAVAAGELDFINGEWKFINRTRDGTL
jgi:hypothetical protein